MHGERVHLPAATARSALKMRGARLSQSLCPLLIWGSAGCTLLLLLLLLGLGGEPAMQRHRGGQGRGGDGLLLGRQGEGGSAEEEGAGPWPAHECGPRLQLSEEEPPLLPSHLAPLLPSRARSVRLTEFGATEGGTRSCTAAFARAVAALTGVPGGGLLVVPAGRWLTGPVELASHLTVWLEEGAVVLGSTNPEEFPLVAPFPSYGSGREMPGPSYRALLWGEHLEDVVLAGSGTVDGQGEWWWTAFEEQRLRHSRPCLVELLWSRGLVIVGLTFKDSPFWNIHPLYCSNVVVHGIRVLAPAHSHNTDGIDPDSCSGVLIQDSYFSTGDDAIALYSGWDRFGITFARPTENVTIRSVTINGCHSLAVGSRLSGGIHGVTVDGVVALNPQFGLRLKTTPGRGGHVRDVRLCNVWVRNATKAGLLLTADYFAKSSLHPDEDFDSRAITRVRGVEVVNFMGVGLAHGVRVQGSGEQPFEGLHFEDMHFTLRDRRSKAWVCSNASGTFRNVDPMPCPLLRDIREGE